MLEMKVIDPVKIEWAAPIVFAPKKYVSLTFLRDYLKFHAENECNSYLILRTDDCIDSLGEALVVSDLDAHWSNWQVKIEDGDHEKSTFTSHYEL